tara:strand:+ start:2530 stop:2931 length:402 start_codon:yes stop_codon:yes gene_type:complete
LWDVSRVVTHAIASTLVDDPVAIVIDKVTEFFRRISTLTAHVQDAFIDDPVTVVVTMVADLFCWLDLANALAIRSANTLGDPSRTLADLRRPHRPRVARHMQWSVLTLVDNTIAIVVFAITPFRARGVSLYAF